MPRSGIAGSYGSSILILGGTFILFSIVDTEMKRNQIFALEELTVWWGDRYRRHTELVGAMAEAYIKYQRNMWTEHLVFLRTWVTFCHPNIHVGDEVGACYWTLIASKKLSLWLSLIPCHWVLLGSHRLSLWTFSNWSELLLLYSVFIFVIPIQVFNI